MEPESASELLLHWQGPFRLPGGLAKFPQNSGVYLWCVERNSRFYVDYIGSAGDLAWRQLQHVVQALGGGYWIPVHDDDCHNGWLPKTATSPAREAAITRAQLFLEDPGLREAALKYVTDSRVFVAETAAAGDAEYLLQEHFTELSRNGDAAARFCSDITLRGSRSTGSVQAGAVKHTMPPNVEIAGLG